MSQGQEEGRRESEEEKRGGGEKGEKEAKREGEFSLISLWHFLLYLEKLESIEKRRIDRVMDLGTHGAGARSPRRGGVKRKGGGPAPEAPKQRGGRVIAKYHSIAILIGQALLDEWDPY